MESHFLHEQAEEKEKEREREREERGVYLNLHLQTAAATSNSSFAPLFEGALTYGTEGLARLTEAIAHVGHRTDARLLKLVDRSHGLHEHMLALKQVSARLSLRLRLCLRLCLRLVIRLGLRLQSRSRLMLSIKGLSVFFSILLVPCFLWSGALESSDVLLSCPTISLAYN